ncbi:methyltransferase domain-containing protein [Rhodobacter sp. CCP-1]|uniref:Methyltransferase domain-containing protein n=2 Tax=Paragemmobacter ruber TaxID=1985673 RepID=A0ABW9Y5E3_9RHOB|nr:methyltransferase domain-containing protein [Rhodobacter ruber]
MYDSPAEGRDCPRGDVVLVEDMETGLVRNAAFDASQMEYDAAYQNEQGNSAQFQRHLDEVASLIETTMGRDRLVEVGCGKGRFLELMLSRGADVTGFDPTYEGSNPRVRKAYFSEALGIRGEGLILRHVLEHIDDPVAFLFRLAQANGGQGLIYIEVPCLDWICTHRAWFDIFYEHVNYFRLTDFHRIFGRVVQADRGFGGQYLRIVADLASLRRPVRDAGDAVSFPEDFTTRLEREATEDLGPCVVWGGASKGVIFALLRERAGHPVDRVIDINPSKQGKYLAGTGLCVLSPEQGLAGLAEGSTIHVMNPNYLPEIAAMAGPGFVYKGMSHD